MSTAFDFNQPANLNEMKQSIADRQFNIKLKGMLISGGLMALGLGAMFLFPGALGVATPLLGLLGVAGGAIAGLVTMKESKKLEIDEEFLQSRMQGRNYWGGYREEVYEHGAPGVSPAFGAPPKGRGSFR